MKKQNSIQNIQDRVGPDTLGILWLSKEHIDSTVTEEFGAINYLLDGNLSKILHDNENFFQTQKKNFFVTKNFSNDLFIAHIVETNNDINRDIAEIMTIASKLRKESIKKIIIIGSKNYISSLNHKYPEFHFC